MIGHTVSHYRILARIGGGGMGEVYKAEDSRLRRTVALKFLAPELTRDADAKRRFIHEAQAASALDHPNICSIFDIDETPEGRLFIVMACYDGESLKERIARRELDVREAFEIAFSVAQGLARAHASGIVHRDIKPGNIMITQDGFVKIVDFGLAKLAGRSRVTGSGATLGTVAYMSPEQARSEETDARADIWALGAILYEMLTRSLPFRGDIDQAMVFSILNEAPRPIANLRSGVPPSCEAIVTRCLEKSPERRYQSCAEFCAAVVDASEELAWGSFATGHVRAVSMVRPFHRKKGWRAPAALALAATLAAGGLAWRNHTRGVYTTELRVAVLPFERIGDTPSQAFVDGLGQWVYHEVDRASRTHDSMWVLPFNRVAEDAPAKPERYTTAFGVNRLVSGTVTTVGHGQRLTLTLRNAANNRNLAVREIDFNVEHTDSLARGIDRALVSLLDMDESLTLSDARGSAAGWRAVFETMGRLSRTSRPAPVDASTWAALAEAPASDSVLAPLMAQRGYAYYSEFALKKDESARALAHHYLDRAIALDPNYSDVSILKARLLVAEERNEDAIAELRQLVQRDPRYLAGYEWLGPRYQAAKRYEEMAAVYRALTLQAPDYYHGHRCLAWVYRRLERSDDELASLVAALKFAPDDPYALNSMGMHYADLGNWSQAREYWEHSFLSHPACGSCSNVGYVLYFENRFADAARYLEHALDYCDTTQFDPWANLASALYYVEGSQERAKALYRKAIRIASPRMETVPDDAVTASWLADFHAMLGNRDEAMRLAGLAENSNDAGTLYRVAEVYEFFGDRARALQYLERALDLGHPMYEVVNEPIFAQLVQDSRFRQVLETERMAAGADKRSR